MKFVKSIPASFALKNNDIPFFYDEKYISTDAFMIKKECVDKPNRYCLTSAYEMPCIERCRPVTLEGAIKYTATSNIRDSAIYDTRKQRWGKPHYCREYTSTHYLAGNAPQYISEEIYQTFLKHDSTSELWLCDDIFCTEGFEFIVARILVT